MSDIASSHVATVREFSRFYTRRLGTLDEGLLKTPWSLTEARVIFELAQAPSTDMAALRSSLALDSGYLSRLLAKFDAAGLIARTVSAVDGRRQALALTAAGRKLFRTLSERSNKQVAALLAPLPEPAQEALVGAMRTVMRTLDERTAPATLLLRGLRPGDLGWIVQRHGEVYAREYGWTQSFEALVARIVADFAERRDSEREAAWIAELDGERVGCVFCTAADPKDTAQLRLLLVEPSARGASVGTRLVDECLRFAGRSGYRRITLWTNDVLLAARRIYQRAGFRCDRREPHHSFGRDLVGEYWSRDL